MRRGTFRKGRRVEVHLIGWIVVSLSAVVIVSGGPTHALAGRRATSRLLPTEADAIALLENAGAKVSTRDWEGWQSAHQVTLKGIDESRVTLVAECAKLRHLKWLVLEGRAVRNEHLAMVKELHELLTLRVAVSSVNGNGLRWLSELKSLQTLDLESSTVGYDGWHHLKNLQSLESLGLCQTAVRGKGLFQISQLSQVRNLRLRGASIGDDDVAALSGMTKLELLDLTSTLVTNSGLAHLQTLRGLHSIYLAGTGVTAAGIDQLGALPHLRQISLGKSHQSKFSDVVKFRKKYPGIDVREGW